VTGLHGFELGLIKLVAGTLAPRPAGEITVTRETGVSALVNGGQRVGMVIVRKAVDIAIQKAKTSGMSVVGVTNYASATGALGVWGREIARAGLIGIVFSQVIPLVVSLCVTRAQKISFTVAGLIRALPHNLCLPFVAITSVLQCPEMVAPYGSYEPLYGTNPFAIGIPTTPRPQVGIFPDDAGRSDTCAPVGYFAPPCAQLLIRLFWT
jgi:L-2-hydroxycarboxylate dehydrogenase (NAD+)